jgi:hypothetical protein
MIFILEIIFSFSSGKKERNEPVTVEVFKNFSSRIISFLSFFTLKMLGFIKNLIKI